MALVRLHRITYRPEGRADDLLHDVSCEIQPRDRVGLIGPNGCGKTTLLRVIRGEIPPDRGEVVRSPAVSTAGYLRQQAGLLPDQTALEATLAGLPQIAGLYARRIRLEAAMETQTGEALARTASDYSDLLDAYHRAGGYTFEQTAVDILMGLGFEAGDSQRPAAHLSSGQRTRVELARLLLQPAELLLLDEPTNHLDIEGQQWLEAYLDRYPGGALIVSHDRYFLDRTVSRILDLRRGSLRSYTGTFTAYAAQRRREEEAALETYERAGKEAQRLRAAMTERLRTARKVQSRPTGRTYDPKHASFYKGKAAKVEKRARVIERRIEQQREQQQASKPFVEKRTSLDFPPVPESSGMVMDVTDLSKRFDGQVVFSSASFSIRRGQRVALIGRNGSGKTTLLRVLLGLLPADSGTVRLGGRVRTGYYSQDQESLDPDRTVLEEAMSGGQADETWARTVLGALLLRRERVHERMGTLSLGEKGRVMLARLFLSGANLLVLDEPTNHLDIDGREALEEALEGYPGTLLFVSHDRRLIERLADTIIVLRDGRLHYFSGTYPEYAGAASGV